MSTIGSRTKKLLGQIKEWYVDPKHWVKGEFESPTGATCLIRAIDKFSAGRNTPESMYAKNLLVDCANQLYDRRNGRRFASVIDFNDSKGVGIAKVRKVVDCAIDRLSSDEA